MSEILKAWEKIKGLTRRAVTGKISPDLSGGDEERIKKKISKCVFAKGGQISGRSRAVELGKIYLNLSKKGREKCMKILAREFDIDNQKHEVSPGSFIEVPPNVEYTYSGQMKLLLIMSPPWFEGNEEITKPNPDVK